MLALGCPVVLGLLGWLLVQAFKATKLIRIGDSPVHFGKLLFLFTLARHEHGGRLGPGGHAGQCADVGGAHGELLLLSEGGEGGVTIPFVFSPLWTSQKVDK